MDLSKPQKFDTCRGQTLFYVPAISRAFFFCILMIFIDFQFYIQFYYTLLSLTTLLHSLTHTHTPLHHLFYIVNNFFSHIRTAEVPLHIIVLCICPILYCELTFYY